MSTQVISHVKEFIAFGSRNATGQTNHLIPFRYYRTFFSDTLACDITYYAILRRKLLLSSLCLVKTLWPWRVMHCERDAADDIHYWCALGRRPFLSLSRQTFLSTFYFNIFRGFFRSIHVNGCLLICYPNLIWWVCPGTQSRPESLGFVSLYKNYNMTNRKL